MFRGVILAQAVRIEHFSWLQDGRRLAKDQTLCDARVFMRHSALIV